MVIKSLTGKNFVRKAQAHGEKTQADDFVILHENITVVQRCRDIISEWLKGMGLELKPEKTRLAHTLNQRS
jgi:RNA-directed DNA polymerase